MQYINYCNELKNIKFGYKIILSLVLDIRKTSFFRYIEMLVYLEYTLKNFISYHILRGPFGLTYFWAYAKQLIQLNKYLCIIISLSIYVIIK
jgi:hypothetical protein